MADVFVSYSREDKARAAQVVRLLEDNGWDVFWDQETRAGTLWPKVLEQELDAARCLLALWTTTSVDSRWVRIEAYEALQTDKLLPLLLDDVRPPLEFRQTQTFDLIGWHGDRDDVRIAHLLADLRSLMQAPQANVRPINLVVETISKPLPIPVPKEAKGSDETPPTGSRRTVILVGAVAAIAIGIAISWSIAVRDDKASIETTHVPAAPPPAQSPKVATAPSTSPPPAQVPGEAVPAIAPRPAPAKPTTTRPSAPTIASVPAVKNAPQRCIEIAEKFQQTGQLTVAERDFLRSKECRQ